MSGNVVVRCDGSPDIGLGHVVRCLALARELRDRHGRSVVFAMRAGPLGIGLVRDAGFPVFESPAGADSPSDSWLQDVIKSATAEVLVLDSRDALALADVRAIRERTGVRVVVIDDSSEARLAADDAFYPPVPQVLALAWPDFAGRVHIGWEWVLLRPEFAVRPQRSPQRPPVVLVTMGGTDPARLTLKAVRGLARVAGPLECILLLGPGYGDDARAWRVAGVLPAPLRDRP